MATVFRSYLPSFYSTVQPSASSEQRSTRTASLVSLDDRTMGSRSIGHDGGLPQRAPLTTCSVHASAIREELTNDEVVLNEHYPSGESPHPPKSKKRGPSYSRIAEATPPLLTRLVETIFGGTPSNAALSARKKRAGDPTQKLLLPSESTIRKQFDDNEKTLRSLVTLLTQIESNVSSTVCSASSPHKDQARNNNRLNDT